MGYIKKSYSLRQFNPVPNKSIEINGRQVSIPVGLFINGEFVSSISGKTFGVETPATGEEVIQVYEGLAEDVDEAVKVAQKTFEGDVWAKSDPAYRGKLLNKLADLMERDAEELIAIEMLDTGKTYAQASTSDLPGSVGTLRYYAGWADKITGDSSFNAPGTFSYTKREPVGVCGQIIPWK